jgi:hypothetical protein
MKLKGEGEGEADVKSRLKLVDFALQQTEYRDPSIPEEDYLLESIKYNLHRKYGATLMMMNLQTKVMNKKLHKCCL